MKDVTPSVFLSEPIFEAKWIAMSYLCSGVFVLDGQELSGDRLYCDAIKMVSMTRRSRRVGIFRALGRCLVVPVYCSSGYREDIVDLCVRHEFRGFGWSVHPLLYDVSKSQIVFREAVQNRTILFYDYLDHLFDKGLKLASRHEHRD